MPGIPQPYFFVAPRGAVRKSTAGERCAQLSTNRHALLYDVIYLRQLAHFELRLAFDLSADIATLDALALVGLFLSAGGGKAELDRATLLVDCKRYGGLAFLLSGTLELPEFFLGEQQFTGAFGIVLLGCVGHLVRGDARTDKVRFTAADEYVAALQFAPAGSQ